MMSATASSDAVSVSIKTVRRDASGGNAVSSAAVYSTGVTVAAGVAAQDWHAKQLTAS